MAVPEGDGVTNQTTAGGHRREIDGLGAIAVTGVVLDHAGVPGFGAGFAGVDIFFVISGFLIGGIVLRAMAEGRFSFAEFYARRARRILPALFVMILATLPVAWAVMTPLELRYFGGGAFSTLLFLSNVWFFNRIDYFNPEATSDPLIHTWSLAVEEQFYVILPILLLVLWRFGARRRGLAWVLGLIAAASLLWALVAPPEQAMAGFYLIHTRAWELLAGVLAAMLYARAQALPGAVQRGLAAMGLALSLAAITLLPHDAGWPGGFTLVPVTGALLVLVFGATPSRARQILSIAPMVWLGAVSYSAYLWHQPILGFLAVSDHDLRGVWQVTAYLAATLALAYASWRFVEQPFRLQQLPRRMGRWALGGMAAVILGFAVGGHVTDGYPQRLPVEIQDMLTGEFEMPARFKTCIGRRHEMGEIQPQTACVHGADVAPSVVIWGDSHAGVLADPLGRRLAPHGLAIRELTLAGCPPVPGLESPRAPEYVICEDHNRRMLDYVLHDPAIKVVILHAYWNYSIQRVDYDNGAGDNNVDWAYLIRAGADKNAPDAARFADLTAVFQAHLSKLAAAGKAVIVIGPVPEPGFDVLYRVAMLHWKDGGLLQPLTIPAKAPLDYAAPARDILGTAAAAAGAVWIDPAPLFCAPGGDCTFSAEGRALYFDDNHLARAGAARLIPGLEAAVLAGLKR